MSGPNKIKEDLREAFRQTREKFEELQSSGKTTSEYGGEVDDFAAVADIEMTQFYEGFFAEREGYVVLSEEGSRKYEEDRKPVIIDEFDGTANMLKGEGELPFGPVIAIADAEEPSFQDVYAAGYLEVDSGNYYEAARDDGASFSPDWSGSEDEFEPIQTSGRESLEGDEPASGIVDLYMLGQEASHVVDELNDRAYLGDFRSWAEHMILVARGEYDFAITGDHNALQPGKRATAEELASGYRIVEEAGGAITDWEGNDIGPEYIGFEEGETFDVVVAATEDLVEEVVSTAL